MLAVSPEPLASQHPRAYGGSRAQAFCVPGVAAVPRGAPGSHRNRRSRAAVPALERSACRYGATVVVVKSRRTTAELTAGVQRGARPQARQPCRRAGEPRGGGLKPRVARRAHRAVRQQKAICPGRRRDALPSPQTGCSPLTPPPGARLSLLYSRGLAESPPAVAFQASSFAQLGCCGGSRVASSPPRGQPDSSIEMVAAVRTEGSPRTLR